MDTTLLVLAAGMGSRYGGIKQLDRLGPSGETIMDYSIYDALRAGFSKVVFVIRHDFADDFKKIFIDKLKDKTKVEIAYQELNNVPEGTQIHPERKKPWGTAHAMLVTKDLIEEPFAVINADDFYGRQAYQTMADFLKTQAKPGKNEYAMVGYKLENTLSEYGSVSRGICKVDSSGYLQSVEEHVKIERNDQGKIISYLEDGTEIELPGNALVSMNFWGFDPSIFDIIQKDFDLFLQKHSRELKSEIYTPKVVDDLISRGLGKVKMLSSDANWFGVTYADDKPKAVENLETLTQNEEYPRNLWDS
ncbi:MAG: nucleotidyltransferase family protein [Bacteroidota bacterium]